MSDEIPYIDLGEFREAGFLQEANRLFFHPLGLALEMTVVDEDGDARVRRMVYDALKEDCQLGLLIQNDAGGKLPNDEVLARIDMIAERVAFRLAPPGSSRISGVWDYREDPEGMCFAQPLRPEAKEEVLRLRAAHSQARYRLFYGDGAAEPVDPDEDEFVQPIDWEPPNPPEG